MSRFFISVFSNYISMGVTIMCVFLISIAMLKGKMFASSHFIKKQEAKFLRNRKEFLFKVQAFLKEVDQILNSSFRTQT